MFDFRMGDTVIITDKVSAYCGCEGTVIGRGIKGGLYVKHRDGKTVYHPWGYEKKQGLDARWTDRIGSAKLKQVGEDGLSYTYQWWRDGRVERIPIFTTPDGLGVITQSIGYTVEPPIEWNPDDFEDFHEG